MAASAGAWLRRAVALAWTVKSRSGEVPRRVAPLRPEVVERFRPLAPMGQQPAGSLITAARLAKAERTAAARRVP
jgi:hypothetical protein